MPLRSLKLSISVSIILYILPGKKSARHWRNHPQLTRLYILYRLYTGPTYSISIYSYSIYSTKHVRKGIT